MSICSSSPRRADRRRAGTSASAATAGAELAQILNVPGEHFTVATADAISIRKVVEVFNRFVQLAVIESALGPAFFEFLQFPGSLVEMLPLMAIEIRIPGSHVEIRQHPAHK